MIRAGLRLAVRLRRAIRQWQEDDGNLLSAAVAYYAALSFFPVLLVLISALGFVLRWTAWGSDAETQVLNLIGEYASADVQVSVRRMLAQVQRRAVVGGPLGIVLLIVTAAAMFAHFERAFDRIWNVNRRTAGGVLGFLRSIVLFRLRAFLMLTCLLGLMLLIVFSGVVSSSLQAFTEASLPAGDWIWWLAESSFSVALNWLLFSLLYWVMPKVRVRWSEAARGGLLAAVVWELGRLALTSLLVGRKYSAYGIVGSFIAVLLWFYFAGAVVFLGAEYVQVICVDCQRRRGSLPRRRAGDERDP